VNTVCKRTSRFTMKSVMLFKISCPIKSYPRTCYFKCPDNPYYFTSGYYIPFTEISGHIFFWKLQELLIPKHSRKITHLTLTHKNITITQSHNISIIKSTFNSNFKSKTNINIFLNKLHLSPVKCRKQSDRTTMSENEGSVTQ